MHAYLNAVEQAGGKVREQVTDTGLLVIRIWRDGRPFQLQIGETDLVRKASYKLALECIKEHA